jgi:hypothetical protein
MIGAGAMICGACGATDDETAGFEPIVHVWHEGKRTRSRTVGWRCRSCGATGRVDEQSSRIVWPVKQED